VSFLYLSWSTDIPDASDSSYNPTWMETKYLLINNLNDNLVLSLFDFNDHRKNALMSTATFPLMKLLEDSTQEDLVSQLLKDGKERGELRYDVNYFPVVEPEEGSTDTVMDSSKCLSFLI